MHAPTPQPRRLARYEIVETLSIAGKVKIYRGFDNASQRSVTLKTIVKDPREGDARDLVVQLQNQARTSASLKHSGIVSVYEYGEDGDVAFLATEYVEGCALKERLRLPITDALSIIGQLLNALEYAHQEGVVHGSISPSALILTSKGQLRVSEFGTIKHEAAASGLYTSPEQVQGLPIDRRTDLFLAGIVLYEFLTGVHPFAGPPESFTERVRTERERVPSELNPDVPAALDAPCIKSLAKAMDERYSSARAFCEELQAACKAAFGCPIPDVVSNQTVVSVFLSSLRGQSRRRSTAKPEPPKAQPRQSEPAASVKWEDKTLRTVEKQLAVFIGPLARVVVKEASSKTATLDELYSLVAESLEREADRNAFLARKIEIGSGQVKQNVPPQLPSLHSSDSATATIGAAEIISKPKAAFRSRSEPISKSPPPPAKPVEKPLVDASRKHEDQVSGKIESSSKDLAKQDSKPAHTSEPKPEVTPHFPAPVSTSRAGEDQKSPRGHAKPEGQPPAPAKTEVDMASRLEELLGKQPENLAGYLRENPPQLEEVIYAFVSTIEAVAARYASGGKVEGLVPQNISFDRLGKASIQNTPSALTQSTSGSGVVGSPRYAAPEIFAEKSAGPDGAVTASNVYALGFMFYEILLGKKLFRKTFSKQRTELEWLRWHADQKSKAPTLKSLLPDYPAALSDLLESMLEKNPEKRAADLETILSRLRVIAQQANRTIVMRKPSPSPAKASVPAAEASRKKGRSGLVLLLLLILALAAAGLVIWKNPDLYRRLISLFPHSQENSAPAPPANAPSN